MRFASIPAPLLATALFAGPILAQDQLGHRVEPPPQALDDIVRRSQAYLDEVPHPDDVLGYRLGDRFVDHADAHRVMEALAATSERARWVPYGRSWQGRALGYLVVTRAGRDLAEVQRGMQRLADPRDLELDAQQQLLENLPAVAWIGYSVHGNELSCTEASLALAWHLCAADGDGLVDRILDNCVVVLDPIQNPDGRERFVHHYENTVGRWADREPGAAEHDEPWPGGRVNHYLFDMNRDWFAGTQPETRARWRAYQEWWPQLFIDVHTMGTNSTYYFGPPAVPLHPEITTGQRRWLERYGKRNSGWFDRLGFEYFTREQFDAFYPGYGEGWPTFHGAVGMTFEGASVRGLEVRREDDTVLRLADPIGHHFVSTLGSLETLAGNAREALAEFVAYRRTAVERQRPGGASAYALLAGGSGAGDRRARVLAELLHAQGVEVLRAERALEGLSVRPHGGGDAATRTLPTGTWLVPTGQPAGRLVEALLARHVAMDPDFIAEQLRRHERRKGTQFYDLTGWSLPLLWGVECVELTQPWDGEATRRIEPGDAADASPAEAMVAYLIPWGAPDTPRLLAALQRRGVRVHAADKYFVHGGRRFEAGSLIVKVAANDRRLHDLVVEAAAGLDVEIVGVDSSWVDAGIAFGSNDVVYLEPSRVALLWDEPVSAYGAGHARWTLEQVFDLPTTVVRTDSFGRLDLARYNVLVIPSGRYGSDLARHCDRLRAWIREGGTLVAIGDATRALADEKLGLLAAETEERKVGGGDSTADDPAGDGASKGGDGEPASESDASESDASEPDASESDASESGGRAQDGGGFDYEAAIRPDGEPPARTTGALLRIDLDAEHWLAFGMGESCTAVSTSRDIFTPVKLDRGTNVGIYGERDELLQSGFAFDDKLDQLARKAWLIHQPLGRGHVVAFTEDPNFRGFAVGLRTLFANAVFFGPGH